MKLSLIDQIIREKEMKNERIVAYFRAGFLIIFTVLDLLVYFDLLTLYEEKPAFSGIMLNVVFLIYSITVLIILLKNIYISFLKYIIITFDFTLFSLYLFLDPTITQSNSYWIGTTILISLYIMNILRYSKEATIYVAVIICSVFGLLIIKFKVWDDPYIVPLAISILITIFIGYSITISNKQMITEANTKKLMERYLAPQLINQLYDQGVSIDPGGKDQIVTILFSDIRRFTSISENLTAQQLVSLLNKYLQAMTDVIFKYEGTIDKFIGDAIMTLFGAPIPHEDDALRSIQCAVKMNKALENFNRENNLEIPFKIGIGIHSGEVVVGNIGSDKRLDFTVIGDNVNLASRIEGLTKFYDCPVLISQSTFEQLPQTYDTHFLLRKVDSVIVKGKSKPVDIYEVIQFADEEDKKDKQTLINQFEEALGLYRSRNFQDAEASFNKIPQGTLSSLYIERCRHFIKNPPGNNWSGEFTMETK